MYEFFEHTADLGLRVRAPDLNTLFAEAGTALFAAVVEDSTRSGHEQRSRRRDRRRRTSSTCCSTGCGSCSTASTPSTCSSRRFEVTVGDDGLNGTAWGEPLDPARHVLAHEVKAITYHGLRVEQRRADGWLGGSDRGHLTAIADR